MQPRWTSGSPGGRPAARRTTLRRHAPGWRAEGPNVRVPNPWPL